MAKKTESKVKSNADIIKEFLAISEKVDKSLSEYGGTLDSSVYAEIDEYISTGSYSLNRLISGSIYKGIPRGRVVGFAGEPSTGKSFICGQIIKNAQDMGYIVLHYDSESTNLKDSLRNIGCDLEGVMTYQIDGIEQLRNHAINSCKEVLKGNPHAKILIVLDSYGNLSSAKELRDLDEGKDNADMGCFVPDTMIRVNGGYKKIQDIKEGDIVVTHLNRERRVTDTFKYEDKNQKFKFTIGEDIIEVTPQHKLLVYGFEERKLLWKQAKDIATKDKLVKMKK